MGYRYFCAERTVGFGLPFHPITVAPQASLEDGTSAKWISVLVGCFTLSRTVELPDPGFWQGNQMNKGDFQRPGREAMLEWGEWGRLQW